jgi:hypothetical protein
MAIDLLSQSSTILLLVLWYLMSLVRKFLLLRTRTLQLQVNSDYTSTGTLCSKHGTERVSSSGEVTLEQHAFIGPGEIIFPDQAPFGPQNADQVRPWVGLHISSLYFSPKLTCCFRVGYQAPALTQATISLRPSVGPRITPFRLTHRTKQLLSGE